jgi:uncharacterized membrane protein
VSTRLERWSLQADLAPAPLVAALAIGLFGISWGALHVGFFTHHPVKDTPVYRHYGSAIDRGDVPYRDFYVEYPPAALPTFVLPAIHDPSGRTFDRRFDWIMLVCGAALVGVTALALTRLDRSTIEMAAALGFVAVSPLLLGPVLLSRFDLWPTLLMAGALAAALAGRFRLAAGVLALGFAAKIYPALLLPLLLADAWRRRGRHEALVCAGLFVAIALAIFVPFAVLSPGGVWRSLFEQGNRPLQLESVGAAVLLAAHHLFGLGVTMSSGHGSQNLSGWLPNVVAALQSVVQVVAVVAIWVWFARGEATKERLVRATAAVVVAFVALGKVLSPQFLIWLVPLVPLVRGRRGLAAVSVLGLALVLTQTWFPYRYWVFALHFDEVASWTVLVRDLVLLVLLGILLAPSRPALRRRIGPAAA